jgi:hypothetical protein
MIDKLYEASNAGVKNSARGKRYLFFNSWRKRMSANIKRLALWIIIWNTEYTLFGNAVKPKFYFGIS